MRNNMGNTPDDGDILGTSAYYEPNTEPDPIVQPSSDPYPQMPSQIGPDIAENVSTPRDWEPPRPDTGGFVETFQRLGFSWGLNRFRMNTAMRGAVVEAAPPALHPIGPVGFGTRSNRRAAFLFTDYTPSDEDVARAAMNNWRTVGL